MFVDQDGEGPFDVRAWFEGSDAFALDRRLDAERHLFGVVWGERDWKPAVPSRPHGWTRDELEEVVVDTVAEWLGPLVRSGKGACAGMSLLPKAHSEQLYELRRTRSRTRKEP